MRTVILAAFITFSCLVTFSFQTSSTPIQLYTTIKSLYVQDLNELAQQIATYHNTLKVTNLNLDVLQQNHRDTRLAFKQVEALLSFYDKRRIKQTINGAPLPWVAFAGNQRMVKDPVGLQVLDELVYAEQPLEHLAAIQTLVEQLQQDFQIILKVQQKKQLFHQEIFEALRLELIRIFTLGLTGFDTPGSLQAIPETIQALQGIQGIIQHYQAVVKTSHPTLVQQIDQQFAIAIEYLEAHPDFDTFDRLYFLKTSIHSLYQSIYDLHYALGAAYFDKRNQKPTAINYAAQNIFAEDFLNPNFYIISELNTELAQQKIALGERLFYDKRLSKRETLSCASCHDPQLAFTDGKAKSTANDLVHTTLRNAPTLINAVYADRYFYDLRARRLENQVNHVILNELEFATDYQTIQKKLQTDSTYLAAFAAANDGLPNARLINPSSITDAITAYVASLHSFNSPFDQYMRDERPELSEEVKRGFNLFMGKAACGTCHFAPLFSGTVPPYFNESEAEILGVPTTKDSLSPILDADLGRYASGHPVDQYDHLKHSFKTPTVRNVANTAPYMHNGVYDSLEEVVNFYNHGGGAGMGIPVPFQTLAADSLHLNLQEQTDIIAFMESLSDKSFIKLVRK